jgi:hypothetical protein
VGLRHAVYEYEIPFAEAEEILGTLTEGPVVEKWGAARFDETADCGRDHRNRRSDQWTKTTATRSYGLVDCSVSLPRVLRFTRTWEAMMSANAFCVTQAAIDVHLAAIFVSLELARSR